MTKYTFNRLSLSHEHWKNYKETFYENILVFKKQNYFENILCFYSLNKQIMIFFVNKYIMFFFFK